MQSEARAKLILGLPRDQKSTLHFMDKITEILEKAEACDLRHEKYPFTKYEFMNSLLTFWVPYTDEVEIDGKYVEVSAPTEKKPLYGLYFSEREKLCKFIKAGQYDFDSLRRGNYLSSEQIETFHFKLENLHQASQWELVYFVLELENAGNPDKELYPFSLWSLLEEELAIAA